MPRINRKYLRILDDLEKTLSVINEEYLPTIEEMESSASRASIEIKDKEVGNVGNFSPSSSSPPFAVSASSESTSSESVDGVGSSSERILSRQRMDFEEIRQAIRMDTSLVIGGRWNGKRSTFGAFQSIFEGYLIQVGLAYCCNRSFLESYRQHGPTAACLDAFASPDVVVVGIRQLQRDSEFVLGALTSVCCPKVYQHVVQPFGEKLDGISAWCAMLKTYEWSSGVVSAKEQHQLQLELEKQNWWLYRMIPSSSSSSSLSSSSSSFLAGEVGHNGENTSLSQMLREEITNPESSSSSSPSSPVSASALSTKMENASDGQGIEIALPGELSDSEVGSRFETSNFDRGYKRSVNNDGGGIVPSDFFAMDYVEQRKALNVMTTWDGRMSTFHSFKIHFLHHFVNNGDLGYCLNKPFMEAYAKHGVDCLKLTSLPNLDYLYVSPRQLLYDSSVLYGALLCAFRNNVCRSILRKYGQNLDGLGAWAEILRRYDIVSGNSEYQMLGQFIHYLQEAYPH